MKIKNFVFAIFLAIGCFFVIPSAQAHEINFLTDFGYWGGDSAPILTCTGGSKTLGADGKLIDNPKKCTVCELVHTTTHIVYFVLSFLMFIAIPLLIMWGGFLILISQGSSEKIGEGKKIITGAFVGAALGIGAYMIVNTFISFLAPSVGGTPGWGDFNCAKDIPEFLQPK